VMQVAFGGGVSYIRGALSSKKWCYQPRPKVLQAEDKWWCC
jgi:hypothetical protein